MSMSKRPPNVGGLLLVCDYIKKSETGRKTIEIVCKQGKVI